MAFCRTMPELLARSFSAPNIPQTPPTFLIHTDGDTGVPPDNSVAFYLALRKAKVPAEMHIFEKGKHGLGMGKDSPGFDAWPGLCATWMRGRGLLDHPAAK